MCEKCKEIRAERVEAYKKNLKELFGEPQFESSGTVAYEYEKSTVIYVILR